MSQFKKMVFKSTLLIHSVFEESQLESHISIAGYYHRQNNFSNCAKHRDNVDEN